jgi:Flp pilus assembly protein TadG
VNRRRPRARAHGPLRILHAMRDDRGAVAVAGVLLTFALALLIGAGVDAARAFILRARLTAIADDAALAGAGQLDLDAWRAGELALDPELAQAAAENDLEASPGITDTVSAGRDAVEVTVSEPLHTFALRLVGIAALDVTAVAQASPRTP